MSQITDEQVEAACQAFTSDWADQDDYVKEHYRKNMRAALEAAAALSTPPVGAETGAQGSCVSCNGTGDLGGNPSYGMCPDCDGTGKFPPAPPRSDKANVDALSLLKLLYHAINDGTRHFSVGPGWDALQKVRAFLEASPAVPNTVGEDKL